MKKKNIILMAVLMISAALAFNAPLAIAKDMAAKDFIEEARKGIAAVDVAAAKAIFDKGGAVFLDCRTEKEFKSGHIPGAIHIPRGLLEFQIENKISDKNKEIVVYCKTGGRASLATFTLVRMGYKNVKNLDGGWKAWVKAGNPVE
ncbi:MAG: rhodanese-like domain-containing protein [Deltaproteobacteria bacterium]|nr:rhodanese-like domain-containing protein [Deltaproteobacteria bacterium]